MRSGRPAIDTTDIVLLRLATPGAQGLSQTDLLRDFRQLIGTTKLRDADNRLHTVQAVLTATMGLAATDALIVVPADSKAPIQLTERGLLRVTQVFGESVARRDWKTISDKSLTGLAVGLPLNAGPQRLKRLDTAAGLRLAVVRRGWKLKVPETGTVGQVRNALAARALGDAFGKTVQTQIDSDARMSGKTGRTIAAQLLKKKRRVSSDGQLITALAAQHLDISQCDMRSMRQTLVRRLLGFDQPATGVAGAGASTAPETVSGSQEIAQSRVDPATLDDSKTPEHSGPTGAAFLRAVRSSAKLNANGWSGNRKAYISHVWRTFCDSHPDWRIDVEMFKSMLTDAHRDGHIHLINADLRDKDKMRDIEDSTIQYKNMEWHFVQVAD